MQETQQQGSTDSEVTDIPEAHKQALQDRTSSLERPANRRLKKAPIILVVGTAGVFLVSALYIALSRSSTAGAQDKQALIDPEANKRAMPDALKLKDSDYAPALGEPLAGDLGGFQLNKPVAPAAPAPLPVAQSLPKPIPAYQPPPAPKQPTPEELAKLRREELARRMAEKALTAGLFFDVPTTQPQQQNAVGVAGNTSYLSSPRVTPPPGLRGIQPLPRQIAYQAQPAGQQQQYQQLLAASRQGQGGYGQIANYRPSGNVVTPSSASSQLQAAGSPYQVKAGTLIPAVLLTGINADLPGQIIAQVREQIFDTVTGQYLLIPQGSRVLGQYDNNVGYGQERAGVVWNRLILPDGSSLNLGNMPGVDSMGQSGYQDQVDHHWGRLTTGVVLSSLLAGTAGYQGQRDDYAGRFYENAGMEVNRAGQRLTRNNLNIQPTIQIRPGFSINILVNRDLTLKPIAPNQNNAWEASVFPVQYQ